MICFPGSSAVITQLWVFWDLNLESWFCNSISPCTQLTVPRLYILVDTSRMRSSSLCAQTVFPTSVLFGMSVFTARWCCSPSLFTSYTSIHSQEVLKDSILRVIYKNSVAFPESATQPLAYYFDALLFHSLEKRLSTLRLLLEMKQVFWTGPPPAHAFPSGFLRLMSSGHMETYCSSETLWSVLCWDARAHGSPAKEIGWWWHAAVGPASREEPGHTEVSLRDAGAQDPHAWRSATGVLLLLLFGSIPINVTRTNIITNSIFSLPRPPPRTPHASLPHAGWAGWMF